MRGLPQDSATRDVTINGLPNLPLGSPSLEKGSGRWLFFCHKVRDVYTVPKTSGAQLTFPSVTNLGSACLMFKECPSSVISRGFSIWRVLCKKELLPTDDGVLLDNEQHKLMYVFPSICKYPYSRGRVKYLWATVMYHSHVPVYKVIPVEILPPSLESEEGIFLPLQLWAISDLLQNRSKKY